MVKVGIVGATGAVGKEILSVLHDRKFAVTSVHLFASARSAGKTLDTPFGPLQVQLFTVEAARAMDYVFLAVSGSFALEHAEAIAAPGGAVVIDNSSAFRMQPNVPLVIPEINGAAIGTKKLIANPNCTTAIAVMALWPLHCHYGIEKMIVSTYQASSGAGVEGMEELFNTTREALDNPDKTPSNKVFAHPLAFNVIPHIDVFQPNGFTKEEMKVTWETNKIFDETNMKISCTAVRIPILRAHSEAITIKTKRPITPADARALLSKADGVDVVDDPAANKYPMPLNATAKYNIEVGRIRQSIVFDEYGLDLFVSGDQLLRGAALNAVLIAEYLEKPYPSKFSKQIK
ncbi:aspartate-semialdehyde dehydrogenase [Thraustotheca clavata]|uniref:aspartate-semialdehyde dehydrogenase n=1 Tax=Thraustotheca clavata TaxID=74557 RepID=A0A1V9ZXU9_9STRA|nr:aspartate-semialdehyde dehydrogenase [Thraustotheca clavata]